jgi:hypothetical protein
VGEETGLQTPNQPEQAPLDYPGSAAIRAMVAQLRETGRSKTAHAHRLLDSAAAIAEPQKISPIGDTLCKEGQDRELVRFPNGMRSEALRLAMELSEDGDLTARNLRQAAVDLRAVPCSSRGCVPPGRSKEKGDR